MLLSSCALTFRQWLFRKKRYRITAVGTVIQSLCVTGSKAGLGLVWPTATVLVAVAAGGALLKASIFGAGVLMAMESLNRGRGSMAMKYAHWRLMFRQGMR